MNAPIERSVAALLARASACELAPASEARAVPARPLYLVGSGHIVLTADGPALVVRINRRAPVRYPVVRVARIVSGPSVQWESGALTICIRERVPVVFTERDGTVVSRLEPMARLPSSLAQMLEQWLGQASWRASFDNWLRAERMRVIARWRRSMHAAGKVRPESQVRELVRRYVYMAAPVAPLGPRSGIFGAALLALVSEQVRNAGVAHRYLGFAGQELDVASELCSLLELQLALRLGSLGQEAHLKDHVVLRVLHAFKTELVDCCTGVLGRLHRRAREEAVTCQ